MYAWGLSLVRKPPCHHSPGKTSPRLSFPRQFQYQGPLPLTPRTLPLTVTTDPAVYTTDPARLRHRSSTDPIFH